MLHPARKAVLKSQKRSQSDPTTSTISVDAILFQSVRVPEEDLFDDVHKLCESALATSASEATVDHCVDPLRWGNSQGLSVLEKLDLLTSDVKSLKDETTSTKTGMANLETEIADLKTEIADLNAKINILAPESTSYLAIRNRFFSTYRRDILGSTNSKDRDAVPFGNKKAHAGDIITDRRLYENGTRFDDEIFEDLYGIHWARVHQIEEEVATINALNSHASAVANKDYAREHLTPLNTAFNKLIQLMKENQFRSFAHLPNAPETIAMAEYNKENKALINSISRCLGITLLLSGFAALHLPPSMGCIADRQLSTCSTIAKTCSRHFSKRRALSRRDMMLMMLFCWPVSGMIAYGFEASNKAIQLCVQEQQTNGDKYPLKDKSVGYANVAFLKGDFSSMNGPR